MESRLKFKALRRAIKDHTLRGKLGEYVTAKELHKMAGITHQQQSAWREKGKVRAQKKGAIFFYSREDVIAALKND